MSHARLAFGAVLSALAILPAPGRSQVVPHRDQHQVNTYTTNTQDSPDVGMDLEGRFVVVWNSSGSNGIDDSHLGVLAQRFDAHGHPTGPEFQVNTYTTDNQGLPAVAMGSSGDFVVVWQSRGSSGTDNDGDSVQLQRFSSTGDPLGGELQVNEFTEGFQGMPDIAAFPGGGFVVVWSSALSSDPQNHDTILGRRFSATGDPLGSEFQVESHTTGSDAWVDVAAGPGGEFVVVWSGDSSSGTDSSSLSVQARRFFSDGSPAGAQFQVNTHTTGAQWAPAVTIGLSGDFVIAWISDVVPGSDSDTCSVQAQRYSAAGNPDGGQVQLNSFTTGHQHVSAIASAEGGFVASWSSSDSPGPDFGYGIQAGRFEADGVLREPEFQVNTYTTDYQVSPAAAADGRGNFVVAWTSWGSQGSDSSSWSVQMQLYDALFRDGFETGGTSRWSSVAP